RGPSVPYTGGPLRRPCSSGGVVLPLGRPGGTRAPGGPVPDPGGQAAPRALRPGGPGGPGPGGSGGQLPGEPDRPVLRALGEVGHREGTGVPFLDLPQQRDRVVRRDQVEREARRDRAQRTEDGGVPDDVRDGAHVEHRGLGVVAPARAAAAGPDFDVLHGHGLVLSFVVGTRVTTEKSGFKGGCCQSSREWRTIVAARSGPTPIEE